MQIYSRRPARRSRQIIADLLAAASIVFFIVLGVTVGAAISALADFGRQVEASASKLQGTLGDAASSLGAIPLVGQGASRPLAGAASAAASLADAGRQQQQVVGALALTIGLLVALVPIAVILLVWLRRRLAFVRRAARARRLATSGAGVEFLALQTLLTRDAADLLTVGSTGENPIAAWRAGDPATIRMLADSALRRAGVL